MQYCVLHGFKIVVVNRKNINNSKGNNKTKNKNNNNTKLKLVLAYCVK